MTRLIRGLVDLRTGKAVRPKDIEAAVQEALRGTEPRRGDERQRPFTGVYPKEVVTLVNHKRRADPSLTETDALVQTFSERPDLYAKYDRERMHHLPVERRKAPAPDERPAAVRQAEAAVNAHIGDYAERRGLPDPSDPAVVAAALAFGEGPHLYGELDRAKAQWLRED